MELKNVSEYRPNNMIIDIVDEDVEEILKTKEFIKNTQEKLIVEKKKDEKDEDDEEVNKSKLYN